MTKPPTSNIPLPEAWRPTRERAPRRTTAKRRRRPSGPVTGAEFKVIRETLGLTTRWLADHLQRPERTVQRWDSGATPVPEWVREQMSQLQTLTAEHVRAGAAACTGRAPRIWTYRTDTEFRHHHPEVDWPASWHRAVVARIAEQVPELVIDFWVPKQQPPTSPSTEPPPARSRVRRARKP
ncbi:hypothetical protein AB0C34_17080 [Nocardia sp. NPDC049220]|uniref:helix-turn-helix domain-containing protein n=1 Tax=Nocardia sp. NPDC049220 TaxID=3155273 RepID=UPI0033FEF343